MLIAWAATVAFATTLHPAAAQDVSSISVAKGLFHNQRTSSGLQDWISQPYFWNKPYGFTVQVAASGSGTVEASDLVKPGDIVVPVPPLGGTLFQLTKNYGTEAELQAAYPDGGYRVSIDPANDNGGAVVEIPLDLPAGSFPPAPRVTNIIEIAEVPYGAAATVRWEPWLEARRATPPTDATYLILLYVYDDRGAGRNIVYSTGFPGQAGPIIDSSDTSHTIPAGTIPAGQELPAELLFLRILDSKTSPYTASSVRFSLTNFYIGSELPLILSRGVADGSTLTPSYSHQLQTGSGIPPYEWQLLDGDFGGNTITLSATGALSGITNTAGAFDFRVQCRSSGPWHTRELTLFVINPFKPDILAYGLFKGRGHHQTGPSTVVSDPERPFQAFAFGEAASPRMAEFATYTPAGGSEQFLYREDTEDHIFRARPVFSSRAELDATVMDGSQSFLFSTTNQGEVTPSVTVTGGTDPFPPRPQLTPATWTAISVADSKNEMLLEWNPWAGAAAPDRINIEITGPDEYGNPEIVFQSPMPWQADAIDSATTSFPVPANTLIPGRAYTATITFTRVTDTTTTSYLGSTGYGGYSSTTRFRISTAITYQDWVEQHFVPSYWNDPTRSGPNADFDGDGLTNLEEYGYICNASQRDALVARIKAWRTGDSTRIAYRHRNTATDLTYLLKQSDDLSTWSDVATPPDGMLQDEGTWSESYHSFPAGATDARFYRVHLSLDESP